MHPNLSFDQAPPISAPLRFFLTAPVFLVLGGLLLAGFGPTVLDSRWTPGALALTHALTVGFMLQAMCGALLQFVPVSTGGNIWQPLLLARLLHPVLAVAGLLLVSAFALGWTDLFRIAAPLFGVGLGTFILVVGYSLWRTPATGLGVPVLRLAMVGISATLVLGVMLAIALGWQMGWPLLEIVTVHAAWGLGGWALMLVIGVSNQVVPMFQLTPPYPAWAMRWLPRGLVLALVLWSLPLVGGDAVPVLVRDCAGLAGMMLAAVYASITLRLQIKRRRRLTDPTFIFWRGAMLALLALFLSWGITLLMPSLAEHPRMALWFGVLALPGIFVSVINGMMYKIVPFLVWLHLQHMGGIKVLPPNIKQLIPEQRMRGQLWAHFIALALTLSAVLLPVLAYPAGLAFAVSGAWLEWNLAGAVRRYLEFRKQMLKDQTRADAACRES